MTPGQKPHPLTPYLFSFFLSACMSGTFTFRRVSLANGAIGMWMTSWLSSFIVAFLTVLVVAPLVIRLAEAITSRLSWPAKT